MPHHCHADNCSAKVPPRMFMCLKHWRLVPKVLQQEIWSLYRPGQEIDKQPSLTYLKTTQQARLVVSLREKGYTLPEIVNYLKQQSST